MLLRQALINKDELSEQKNVFNAIQEELKNIKKEL